MRFPTSAWSTIPCNPPTTLVSIVGQASFHTAGRSGPSIIDRSYFLRPGLAPGSAATGAAGAAAVASDNSCHHAPAGNESVDAPWTRAGEHEIQKHKAKKNGGSAPVHGRPEREWKVYLKVRHRHLAGQHERDRPGQKTKSERRPEVRLQNPRQMKLPHWRHGQIRTTGWKWRKTEQLQCAASKENESRDDSQDTEHSRR